MVSRERIESQFEQYVKALDSLKNVLNEKPKDKNYQLLLRDSAIKRFEYTYELAWKLIKHFADFYNGIKCIGPRDSFKAGFKTGLIKDQFETVFYEMIEKRNQTVHTYKEETAQEIYEFIKNEALPAFLDLKERIQEFI